MTMALTQRIFNVIFVLFEISTLHSHSQNVQKDYCSWEVFTPSCGDNEVVMMQKATYGLMEEGRCVLEDLGFTGCFSDQLGFFDAKCSGRKNCEVNIHSKELKAKIQSCPEPYLDATYYCMKVFAISENSCHGTKQLDAKPVANYIASLVSLSTGCGYGDSPFIIKAHKGQKIKLTLIDFAWNGRSSWQKNSECERLYGHALNTDNTVTDICGTAIRESNLLLSSDNHVQIILQEDAMKQFRFLIKYEAVGCAEIIPPKNSWIRKIGNDMTVGCHTSSDTWQLKCIGNHWIGVIGNCTKVITIKTPVAAQKQEFSGHHVFAVAIGCIAVIVCCVTVTVGIYFVRRYKIKLKSQNGNITSTDICLLPKEQWLNTTGMNNSIISTHTDPLVNHQPPGQTLLIDNRQPTLFRSGHPTPVNSSLHVTGNTMARPDVGSYSNVNQGDTESVQYYVLEKPPGYIGDGR